MIGNVGLRVSSNNINMLDDNQIGRVSLIRELFKIPMAAIDVLVVLTYRKHAGGAFAWQSAGETATRKVFSMVSNPQRDTKASVFPASDVATSRDKALANWPERLPALAPWSKLSWGLFIPLAFAGNVIMSILAWFVVGLVMR
jgi:hypothetical protein